MLHTILTVTTYDNATTQRVIMIICSFTKSQLLSY